MLGETYELVTDEYRFVAEQVSHHPPYSAFAQEGKGYHLNGTLATKSKLGFGGGTGVMVVYNLGSLDYYLEDFDEVITAERPTVHVQNVVLGNLYIDYEGENEIVNQTTGLTCKLTYTVRGWATESRCQGSITDASGTELYKLDGSTQQQMWLTDVQTGERTLFLDQLPVLPREFNFGICDVNLNYKSSEMDGVIPPTDARYRNDMRLWEQGKEDEADEEKVRLEVKQRRARKIRAENNE